MKTSPDHRDNVTTMLDLPIKNPYYSTFPVFIHYMRGIKHPKVGPTDRLIAQSVMALAMGHVDIHGKKVLFQYPFEPRISAISNSEGLFGVDVNGDGKIRDEQFSPESSFAADDEIVFPFGDGYISTQSVDLATGKIVVRKRDKSEYHRVDLNVGDVMPDFTFTDLQGKERHLSDFRGKYLMVDFWGVWCGDCQRETPYHLEAYKRFKGRSFEILGLDSDKNIEIVKAYLTKNGMTWPQATNDSIKQLANVTYRIQEYPSTILLGPDGKVWCSTSTNCRATSC
jgi:peroxiredoxin